MALLTKITNLKNNLSASSRRIAQIILDTPSEALKMSSQEMAQQANVSQSTVIKFAQKVGFKGFPALKLALSQELGRKRATNESHNLHNEISIEDSIPDIAHKLLEEKIKAIRETTESINYDVFDSIVELIDNAQRVQLVGIGGSALVAKDFSYKLLKIGINTISELDTHVQVSVAQTLSPKDVQFVISFSGNKKDVSVAVQSAKSNGVPIVALTSVHGADLRKIADYCLDCVADESRWRSSSISSREAQNTVIDLIFMALIQKRGEMAETLISESREAVKKLEL